MTFAHNVKIDIISPMVNVLKQIVKIINYSNFQMLQVENVYQSVIQIILPTGNKEYASRVIVVPNNIFKLAPQIKIDTFSQQSIGWVMLI